MATKKRRQSASDREGPPSATARREIASPRVAQFVAELTALSGSEPMRLRRDQVLVYRGHLAAGVFVILSGALRMQAKGEPNGAREISADTRPIVIPASADLDCRGEHDVVASRDAEVLFLPRSLVETSGEVVRLLAQLAAADPHDPTSADGA